MISIYVPILQEISIIKPHNSTKNVYNNQSKEILLPEEFLLNLIYRSVLFPKQAEVLQVIEEVVSKLLIYYKKMNLQEKVEN